MAENIFYSIIYDRCGQWDSTTLENINLIRAVFADKTCDFSRIIAYTFFYILDDKKKTFTIPEKIEVPESIVKISKKTNLPLILFCLVHLVLERLNMQEAL